MQTLQPRLLLVDGDPVDHALVHTELTADPSLMCLIDDAPDIETLERLLRQKQRYDLALAAMSLQNLSGAEIVQRIQEAVPELPIVMLVRTDEIGLAAQMALHQGIAGYVLKGESHGGLLPATVRGVLERVAARRAAREAEERFRRLAENAPDMIFRWSYARGFEYVSPASTEVVGYTPEEHYADPGLGYRVIHPDDIPVYESVFSDLADPEGPRRYCVIRWFHKDGHIVHVEMRMTPIFDARGELVAIEGIARDISQHVIARARLRELTSRLTQAQEEERRRIARELHDEIGQELTIAKMRLRMVENALPAEAEAVHEKLKMLGTLLDETLQNVRHLSHELRPPLLDEMGWEPALALVCDTFSQRTELPVIYRHSGSADRLDPDVEMVAYRVVQESLTNVARHANARQVVVHADLSSDELTLTIEDDGQGFDMAALDHTSDAAVGLGLLGMQERVDMVGGRIQIVTAPGKGTRVEVHLPRKERRP